MCCMILGNSAPAIAPTGGRKALLGTNPICFAFPTGDKDHPIILDMATSIVSRGKIRLAARNDEKIPEGWALDSNGKPTTDPLEAIKGSLIPIGNYKGYGLSLAVDILAGLLTGSAFGSDVNPLNHPNKFSRHGHFMLVLNPEFFLSSKDYTESINRLIKEIKSSGENVLLPGEKSNNNYLKNKEYVSLKETQIKDTNKLANSLNTTHHLV